MQALGHMWMGFVLLFTNRAAQGIVECDHALELDRNLAAAHSCIGLAKVYLGHAEETEDQIREALRLSPHDTYASAWMNFAGLAKLYLGNYEDAVTWFRSAIEANRNYPQLHFQLAAALAQLGKLDEARSEVGAGLALNPTFTISRVRAGATSDNATLVAQRERLFEGLRKAGVPEQ